jgi:hypothetical protein
MKTRFSLKVTVAAFLSMWLATTGCAQQPAATAKEPASMASPEATAAIASANAAIKTAKANNWIWRDTEQFAAEAQAAADKGENDVAIKLANMARKEAENATAQFNYENSHPRGM